MGQGTGLVGQCKAHRSLVDPGPVDLKGIVEDKEPREILFVCLYAFGYDFKAIYLRRKVRCDCSHTFYALLYDICGAFRRVTVFHQTYLRIIVEVRTGLVYRHVMGPDLSEVLDLLARQSHEVLLDAQEDFALDLAVVFAEELEVRQESSGDGVLYRHDCRIRLSFIHPSVQVLERRALDDFRFRKAAALVELVGCLLVKASLDALNRYPCHCFSNKKAVRQIPDSIEDSISYDKQRPVHHLFWK